MCITTAQDVKSLGVLGSSITHGKMEEDWKKSHGCGTQLSYSVWGGWVWLTRANNYWQWKLDSFLWVLKKKEQVLRKLKNKRWTGDVNSFLGSCVLVYTKFGPDVL